MIDLHIHTNYSDGTDSPEEIIKKARKLGLKQIAITDHNTLEGALAGARLCRKGDPDFVVGTELSCMYRGKEIHLLGYFPKWTSDYTAVNDFTARGTKARELRHKITIEKLNKLGFEITYDELVKYHSGANRNRVHISELLVQKGYADSVGEVFEKYFGKGKPCFTENDAPPLTDAAAAVHRCGGLAVPAHFYDYKEKDFEEFFADVIGEFDGIECYHSKHTPIQSAILVDAARRHGLRITGGSDYHGSPKPFVSLGCANVPDECFIRF